MRNLLYVNFVLRLVVSFSKLFKVYNGFLKLLYTLIPKTVLQKIYEYKINT